MNFEDALQLATKKHAGQLRRDGTPYIWHPIAVAGLLRTAGFDEKYQVAGLFHDLLEDTDATEDEINNYWYGVSSPYATKLTYCAVAYSKETGSNIIISYVNPKAYYMSDLTPVEYLNMTASKYTGLTVSEGPYLGKTYAMLDIPADQSSIGERAQFVTEVEGLLVVITYTVQEGDSLKSLSNHIVQLNTKK